METTGETKEMGLFGRIAGIFSSPTETFQAVASKPAWWLPFVISIIVAVGIQVWLADIGMKDQLATISAKDWPAERIEAAKRQVQGPARYINLAATPVAILAIWALISAFLLLGSNPIGGGEAKFGQMMGVVAWSSFITTLGGLLKSILIFIQGTSYGLTISLAALLPVPPRGATPSALYHILSKMDPFMVWQVFLWGMGISIVAKIKSQKAQFIAFGLWIIWIALSLVLRNLFAGFM